MKNKYLFILGIMYWCTCSLCGQSIISGRVFSAEDGKPLPEATIQNDELHMKHKTDSDGIFRIELSGNNTPTFIISAAGYASEVLNPVLLKQDFYKIYLHKSKRHMEEFIITAISPLKNKRSVSSYTVTKKEDLQSTGSTNIIDAISINPSVSQITTGGGISKPVIRGLAYNRVVVAKNGIRQEDQQWGSEHGVQIGGADVQRVEILNAPSSLLFGGDALGGVINISTERHLPKNTVRGKISSQYQTNNGLREVTFEQEGKLENIFWGASLSTSNARNYTNKYDGRVFNTGFENLNFSGDLGYQHNWGATHLFMSGFYQKLGINEGKRDKTGRFTREDTDHAHDHHDDHHDHTIPVSDEELRRYEIFHPYQKLSHYMIHLKQDILLGKHKIKWNLAYQHNDRKEIESTDHIHHLVLQTYNYDLRYHLPAFDKWKLTLGINGMFQKNNTPSGHALIPDYHFTDLGGFAHVMKTFKKLHLEGGIRYDTRDLHSETIDNFTALKRRFDAMSGSAGFSYALWPGLIFKANYAKGFRAPALIELTANGSHHGAGRFEKGSNHLRPESSHQIGGGILYEGDALHIELSTFYNRIRDFIFLHKSLDPATGLPEEVQNGWQVFKYAQSDAQLYGGELLFNLHPKGWLHWNNSFGLVKGRFVDAENRDQRNIPRIPATKWRSELEVKLGSRGDFLKKAFLKLGYTQYFAQNEVFAAYKTETRTPAYGLLHAGIGATFVNSKGKEWLELSILGDNLLDVAYQDHLSRYKYMGTNEATGRKGIFNMGRNITFKLTIPINML